MDLDDDSEGKDLLSLLVKSSLPSTRPDQRLTDVEVRAQMATLVCYPCRLNLISALRRKYYNRRDALSHSGRARSPPEIPGQAASRDLRNGRGAALSVSLQASL